MKPLFFVHFFQCFRKSCTFCSFWIFQYIDALAKSKFCCNMFSQSNTKIVTRNYSTTCCGIYPVGFLIFTLRVTNTPIAIQIAPDKMSH